MNWHSDPPNGWTALYRLAVLATMAYLAWAAANNPDVPELIPTIQDAIESRVG